MEHPSWQRVRTNSLLQHPRIPAREDTVRLPDGTEAPYAVLDLPDAVTAVIEHAGSILLNFEYAYPVDDRIHRPASVISDGWIYKFPGGMLKPGENAGDGVVREVAEETGLAVGSLQVMAHVRNFFPRSNSIDYKVTATLTGTARMHRDAEEAGMQQEWLSPEAIDRLVANRDPRVMHSHFLDTWLLYKSRTA